MAADPEDERLTPRQREVLLFCRERLRERGMMPTKREIACHLGIKNPRDVSPHLHALQSRGLIPLTESQVQQKLLRHSSARWARRDWLDDLAHATDLHAAMKATERYAMGWRSPNDPDFDPEFDYEKNYLDQALWHLHNALDYLEPELETVKSLRHASIIGDEQAGQATDFLWSRLPNNLRRAGFPEWADALETGDFTKAVPPRNVLEMAPPDDEDDEVS